MSVRNPTMIMDAITQKADSDAFSVVRLSIYNAFPSFLNREDKLTEFLRLR